MPSQFRAGVLTESLLNMAGWRVCLLVLRMLQYAEAGVHIYSLLVQDFSNGSGRILLPSGTSVSVMETLTYLVTVHPTLTFNLRGDDTSSVSLEKRNIVETVGFEGAILVEPRPNIQLGVRILALPNFEIIVFSLGTCLNYSISRTKA